MILCNIFPLLLIKICYTVHSKNESIRFYEIHKICNDDRRFFNKAEQICIFESEVKMPLLSITSEIVGRAVYNLNPLNGAPVERLPLFFYFKGAKYEY